MRVHRDKVDDLEAGIFTARRLGQSDAVLLGKPVDSLTMPRRVALRLAMRRGTATATDVLDELDQVAVDTIRLARPAHPLARVEVDVQRLAAAGLVAERATGRLGSKFADHLEAEAVDQVARLHPRADLVVDASGPVLCLHALRSLHPCPISLPKVCRADARRCDAKAWIPFGSPMMVNDSAAREAAV